MLENLNLSKTTLDKSGAVMLHRCALMVESCQYIQGFQGIIQPGAGNDNFQQTADAGFRGRARPDSRGQCKNRAN